MYSGYSLTIPLWWIFYKNIYIDNNYKYFYSYRISSQITSYLFEDISNAKKSEYRLSAKTLHGTTPNIHGVIVKHKESCVRVVISLVYL